MTSMQIEMRPPGELRPRPGNPRTHSKKQIQQIGASITRFGFVNPILLDKDGCVIAGHGRLEAARLLQLDEVPTISITSMNDEEVRAYVIADNRLAEMSGWSSELLAVEFAHLTDLEIDFDPTVTGFNLAEIEGIVEGGKEKTREKSDRLDRTPEPTDQAVTRLGDIWKIGPHRLICGDATQRPVFAALLGDEKATMVFTDPPFNVPIKGHVSGRGKIVHREFVMGSGELSSADFTALLRNALCNAAVHSASGSIHYVVMDWRHARELLDAGAFAYGELKNICIWSKTNAGMGSLYRSAHEMVFVYKSGTAPHINNVELGKNGRFRTNVWTHAGASSFGPSRSKNLAMHPTVKPVALVYDAILDCSRRADIILDPFAGSGTTLVAAQKAKRRGYGIELDPLYCDVIVERLCDLFNLVPTLAADGRTFAEVEQERLGSASMGQAA